MSIFTSKKERRLWLGVLTVMVAIYATLSLSENIAVVLRERSLLGVTIALASILATGVFVWRWVKMRPDRSEILVVISVVAVYGWSLLRIQTPEERTHLVEYGFVAALIYQALIERARNGRTDPRPAVHTVVITALLGWLDEGIQALLPNRVYDIRDGGFNALAGLLAVTASLALTWVRQRRKQD